MNIKLYTRTCLAYNYTWHGWRDREKYVLVFEHTIIILRIVIQLYIVLKIIQ